MSVKAGQLHPILSRIGACTKAGAVQAVDEAGRMLAEKTVPATCEGHLAAVSWTARWPERASLPSKTAATLRGASRSTWPPPASPPCALRAAAPRADCGRGRDPLAWARRLLLRGTELACCEPKRLRYCLLHVAGRIVRHARGVRLRLARSWSWRDEMVVGFARLRALPSA